ncbi:hypothetical protein AU467_23810 [Mesorhizobium loti]|uniref:Uncharacterized protein n=1 Tax=Rhizobium loti TaxID=381 RepID=A0A101KRZ8_RHILI|nr:hypothetical protein AU467_23810 [Mesorhizobium loti]
MHDHEFVASKSCDKVVGTNEFSEVGCNRVQHCVADVVTKGIIHLFESVDIKKVHCKALLLPTQSQARLQLF